MRTILLAIILGGALHANALFTSIKTGNWADPTVWSCGTRTGQGSNTCNANGGVPACHLNIPCETDGGDLGDEVVLAAGFTVTVPAGTSASVGASRATASGVPAVSCVSYASATTVLNINGTFTYAGDVAMPSSTWTITADPAVGTAWPVAAPWLTTGYTPQIIHDSSLAASPSATHYVWATNYNWGNSGASGVTSKLVVNGTVTNALVWGVAASSGTSYGINGNRALACPASGTPGCGGVRDAGNMVATYTHFIGTPWAVTLPTQNDAMAASCTYCTWDDTTATAASKDNNYGGNPSIGVLVAQHSTGVSTFAVNHFVMAATSSGFSAAVDYNTSTSTASQIQFSNGIFDGSPTGTTPIAFTSTKGGASNFTNKQFSLNNVVFLRSGIVAAGTGAAYTGMYSYADFNTNCYLSLSGAVAGAVTTVMTNPGVGNQHPLCVTDMWPGTYTQWVFDGNTDLTSDMFEAQNGVNLGSLQSASITNSIVHCAPSRSTFGDGAAAGSFLNVDPNHSVANWAITVQHNTYCSNVVGNLSDSNVMGVGWEGASAATLAAGTVALVGDNAAFSLVPGGNLVVSVNTVPNGTAGTNVAAGFFSNITNNSRWNATNAQEYGNNLTSAGVAQIASGPTNGVQYTTLPPFADTNRKIETFDLKYLGSPGCTTWTNGASIAVGVLYCDSQSNQYAGLVTSWRARTSHTAATATNRPLTGTAWVTAWEPAALQQVEGSVLAGTTYIDGALRINGAGIITLLSAWERAGYTLYGVPDICTASDGESRGAVLSCASTKAWLGAISQ